MKIKICGIFRNEDVDYINEARPDYAGFVFAKSRRQLTPAQAASLRKCLAETIPTVGVFVDSSVGDIIALYRDGVISTAQLHGIAVHRTEDEAYIAALKEESLKCGHDPIQVIKTIKSMELEQIVQNPALGEAIPKNADYYLIDSGAGSGKTFDWNILKNGSPCAEWLNSTGKPWFLAGGITTENIEMALALQPFCIDVSGGAETDGVKNREKIVLLTATARKGNSL